MNFLSKAAARRPACSADEAPVPEVAQPLPDADPAVPEALARWTAFGGVQRGITGSLAQEVVLASEDMARETALVTGVFQALAQRAQAQSVRAAHLSTLATTVELDGETLGFGEVAALFEGALSEIVTKILMLSKHAMSMVYALDGVSRSMLEVENCIAEVDVVNRQTRMLAMNARIEAARAAGSGAAFGVISDEMRTLSGGTERLAQTMRQHVGTVLGGLRSSHDALRTVATLDMSENIMAKEKLDRLVAALVQRSARLGDITSESAVDAAEIAAKVGAAITSLQFQDRVAQRLAQVTDTLGILGDAVADLQSETAEATPPLTPMAEARTTEWLRDLAGRYRLSEMRAAFVAQVLDGDEPAAPAAQPDAAGSIELF